MEKYEVIEQIGAGSYGKVLTVRPKSEKNVKFVLKKIDLNRASAKERKSAEQECDLLRTLKHPNIVSFKDSFWCSKDMLGIVMSYCEGGDLYHVLKDTKKASPLPEPQIMQWFIQITLAVQYLHTKKILHRDLKTQNIFLTKSRMVKVGDLGIARQLADGEMALTLIGTPYYMSPEVFQNIPYNYKSDIWSLGCILYEMTSLKHAFTAHDFSSLVHKIIKGNLPTLSNHYSKDVQTLIREMLNSDPKKRPDAGTILKKPAIQKNIESFLKASKRPGSARKKPNSGSRPSSGKRRPSRDECDGPSNGDSGGRQKSRSSSEDTEDQSTLKPAPEPVQTSDEVSPRNDDMNFGPAVRRQQAKPVREVDSCPTEDFTLSAVNNVKNNNSSAANRTPRALPDKLHNPTIVKRERPQSDNRGPSASVSNSRKTSVPNNNGSSSMKVSSLPTGELLSALSKKPVTPVKKQSIPNSSERLPSASKKSDQAAKLAKLERPVSASASEVQNRQSKARAKYRDEKKHKVPEHQVLRRLGSDPEVQSLDLAQPAKPKPKPGVKFAVLPDERVIPSEHPKREYSSSSESRSDDDDNQSTIRASEPSISNSHERRSWTNDNQASPREAARDAARRVSASSSVFDEDEDEDSLGKNDFDDFVAILTTTLNGNLMELSADFADINISANTINPQLPTDTMSARPKDRSKVARKDLEKIFEPAIIEQCLDIMAQDKEETEDELRDLIGDDDFDLYVGKLWHLKLLENR